MGTCLRHARGTGKARSLGSFRPPLPGPAPELSETRTTWWQEGWHLGCPLQYQMTSVTLIPASFYLAGSLCVAAKTRLAAQVPTEPDGYGKSGPDVRQQGVVGSVVNCAVHAPFNRGSCSLVVARQECRLSVPGWESELLCEILVHIFVKAHCSQMN